MQNRLAPSQIQTLLVLRHRANTIFSQVPLELIWEMSGCDPKTNRLDFETALHHVVSGEYDELAALLHIKPYLVLFDNGRVTTPTSGLTITNTTLLKCSIGARDPDMIELIKPIYSQFKGGEEKKEKQLELYWPCIQALKTQQPDHLADELMKVILESSREDIRKEIATGMDYDFSHQSKLRTALKYFREIKLAINTRTVTEPHIHHNPQNYYRAFELFWQNYRQLKNGGPDKLYLATIHLMGFIQLLELTAYERNVFAQNQSAKAIAGEKIERSFNFIITPSNVINSPSSFPFYNKEMIDNRSGLGFHFCISIFGGTIGKCLPGGINEFKELTASINNRVIELARPESQKNQKKSFCVIF